MPIKMSNRQFEKDHLTAFLRNAPPILTNCNRFLYLIVAQIKRAKRLFKIKCGRFDILECVRKTCHVSWKSPLLLLKVLVFNVW